MRKAKLPTHLTASEGKGVIVQAVTCSGCACHKLFLKSFIDCARRERFDSLSSHSPWPFVFHTSHEVSYCCIRYCLFSAAV